MKHFVNIICSLLAVLFVFNSQCVGLFYEQKSNVSICSFIEDSMAIIRKYGTKKTFTPRKSISNKLEEEFGEYNSLSEAINTASDNENGFQTCRLIVSSSKKINKLNSIEIASGFKNWYIVQFASEEDTAKAYDFYKKQPETETVTVDKVYQYDDDIISENSKSFNQKTNSVFLNSWAAERTGLYDVKNWFQKNANMYSSEIRVAVLDTGINLNKNIFSDRVYRTYFNMSPGGETDSEEDSIETELHAHGTGVSSVIADSTPNNIKIGMYKVSHMEKFIFSSLSIAVLKAVADGADVINISLMLSGQKDEDFMLFEDALNYAVEKNVVPVAAAGNKGIDYNLLKKFPQSFGCCLNVTASQPSDTPAGFSNFGENAFICAPGVDVPAEYPGGHATGTSISSPLVCAAIAMMKLKEPNINKAEIEHRIKKTAAPLNYPVFDGLDVFGSGVLDLIGAMNFERVNSPSALIVFDNINGTAIAEIRDFDSGIEVYYTTDGSYPSKRNGILYNSAIELSGETDQLRFVAFDTKTKNPLFPSCCVTETVFMHTLGTDDMFEIDENGFILSYSGNVYDLIIPEYINGIKVIGLAENVFSESTFHAVTLPVGIQTISDMAFMGNENIQIVNAEGVTCIGNRAFANSNIMHVNLPNVKVIENEAFMSTGNLINIDLPKCKIIKDKGFYNSGIMYASFENLEIVFPYAFSWINSLVRLYMPNVTELKTRDYYVDDVTGEIIYNRFSAFEMSNISEPIIINKADYISNCSFNKTLEYRAEFSNAKKIDSLPMDACLYDGNCITLALPSTLKICKISTMPEDFWTAPASSYFFNYHIYGTKGTYAEQWARENNYEFFEVSQETALITDLPSEYYDYMFHLYADVVGFNKTYQWYGTTTESNEGGMPISGATSSLFVPKNYTQYPYYYCVVTSTDVGYKPIEIRTGTSRYMDFDDNIKFADYSELDAILRTIPSDLSIYTEDSVDALNEVIAEINRNYYLDEQETVNGFVESVSTAISNLVLKKFVVSFIVDGESVKTENVEFGASINEPENPNKEGYVFKEWVPKIPETMPAKSLTFYAVFEEKKQLEITPSVSIRNFINSRTVDFKTTITFKADIAHLPEKACVVWYKDGEAICSCEEFTVEHATETFVVQARAFDESGKALAQSETELVKVKTDFFSRIIAIFRMIFKALPVIEQ